MGLRLQAGCRPLVLHGLPDTYELGQANQAVRILVNAVNATERLMAERAFLPAVDLIDLMRVEGLPLFSIESCAPLSEFDVIGITLPHELAATNVLEAIDLAGCRCAAAERAEDDPDRARRRALRLQPRALRAVFRRRAGGRGRAGRPEVLELIREMRARKASRAEILRALADVPGTYVPSLYRWRDKEEAQRGGSWIEPVSEGVPTLIEKRVFTGFAQSDA